MLFYLKDLAGGGVQKVHLKIAKSFAADDKPCNLVVNKLSDEAFTKNAKETFENIGSLGRNKLAQIINLSKSAKSSNSKVIVVGNGQEALVAVIGKLMWLHRCKIVYVQHVDIDLPGKNSYNNYCRHLLFGFIGTFCERIVFVSNSLRESVAKRHSRLRRKFQTIYNPILDDDDIRNIVSSESVEKKTAGTNTRKIYLVNVGRLCFQKNQGVLIQSLKHLDELGLRNVHLKLIGEGEDKASLENLVSQLGLKDRVEFVGWVDDPLSIVRESDVFCLTSRWEGLPTVLIEALTASKHIVAMDCKHGIEEILEYGRLGTIVKSTQGRAFAEGIIDRLTRDILPYSERNLERFSSTQSFECYKKVMEEIR